MNSEKNPTRIRRSQDQKRQVAKDAIMKAFGSALDRAETCANGNGVIRAKVQIASKGFCYAEVKFEETETVKL